MLAGPEAIPGDPHVLREAADALERSERRATEASEILRSVRHSVLAAWSARSAQGFEDYSAEALRCAEALAAVGPAAAEPLRAYADELESAQRRYAAAEADAREAERDAERAEGGSRAEHSAREDAHDAHAAMGSAREQALAANEQCAREIRALRESVPAPPGGAGAEPGYASPGFALVPAMSGFPRFGPRSGPAPPFPFPPPQVAEELARMLDDAGEGIAESFREAGEAIRDRWDWVFNERSGASPALGDSPYNPTAVRERQRRRRQEAGVDPNPALPLPDRSPDRYPEGSGGHPERNVNPDEEHSRVAKGRGGRGPERR